MRVVATYNLKGGVGKTSTAVNLAYLASRDGLRTLLWDLDPQGAATYLSGSFHLTGAAIPVDFSAGTQLPSGGGSGLRKAWRRCAGHGLHSACDLHLV